MDSLLIPVNIVIKKVSVRHQRIPYAVCISVRQ